MSQDTIESLRARVAELEVELENEQARGIHSCHPGCLRDGCVNRRLRDQLAAKALTIKTMREALDNLTQYNSSDKTVSVLTKYVKQGREALALPDNSTEILQEWLDKRFGEPVVEAIQEPGSAVRWWWSDEGLALPKGTFLYRKPEIK